MKNETITLTKDQAKVFNLLMSKEIIDANFYAEHGHSDLFLSDYTKLAAKNFDWEKAYAKEVVLSMPTLFDVWDTCEYGKRGDNAFVVNPWSNECLYIIGGERMNDYIECTEYNGDLNLFKQTLSKIVDEEGNVILSVEDAPASEEANLSNELTKFIADKEAKIDALKAEIEKLNASIKSAQHLIGAM